MNNRPFFLVALAIVAASALFFSSRVKRPADAPEDPSGAIEQAKPATIASVSTAQPAQTSAAHPPPQLPAEGTPLAKTFDQLVALASAGDSPSAMRLYSDLTRCSSRAKQLRLVNHLSFPNQRSSEGVINPGAAEVKITELTGKVLDKLDASDQFCEGVGEDKLERRGEILRQAALDGDPEAMVCYAMSTLDVGPKYLSDAWFDYAQRWSQEAPDFAIRAFDSGQADVIPLLIDAYAPNNADTLRQYQFSELVQPDPSMAYRLAVLFQRLSSKGVEARAAAAQVAVLRNNLSPAQISSADAFVNAMWPKFSASAGDAQGHVPCSRVPRQ
jgi:hypothetical protein